MSAENISGPVANRIELTHSLLHLISLDERKTPPQWHIEDFEVVSDVTPQYKGCFVNNSAKMKFQIFIVGSPVIEKEWKCKVWNDRSSFGPIELENYRTLLSAFELVQQCYTIDASAQKWIPKPNIPLLDEDFSKGCRILVLTGKIVRAFIHKMDNSHGREFMVDIFQRCIELCGFGPYIYIQSVGTSPHKDGEMVVSVKREDSNQASFQSRRMEFSTSTSATNDHIKSESSLPVSSDEKYPESSSGVLVSSERAKKKKLNSPSKAKYKEMVVPLKKKDSKQSHFQSSRMEFSSSTSASDDHIKSESSLPVSSDDECLESASGFLVSSERAKKKKLNPPSKAKYKVHSDLQVVACYPNDKYTCQMVVQIKGGNFETAYITDIVKQMVTNIEDRDEIFGMVVYPTGTHLFRLSVDKDESTPGEKILNLAIENSWLLARTITSDLLELCYNISAILNHCHLKLSSVA